LLTTLCPTSTTNFSTLPPRRTLSPPLPAFPALFCLRTAQDHSTSRDAPILSGSFDQPPPFPRSLPRFCFNLVVRIPRSTYRNETIVHLKPVLPLTHPVPSRKVLAPAWSDLVPHFHLPFHAPLTSDPIGVSVAHPTLII